MNCSQRSRPVDRVAAQAKWSSGRIDGNAPIPGELFCHGLRCQLSIGTSPTITGGNPNSKYFDKAVINGSYIDRNSPSRWNDASEQSTRTPLSCNSCRNL